MKINFTLVTLLLILGTSCSTASKPSSAASATAPTPVERTSLEVTYALGENLRHLSMQDVGSSVTVHNYLNKKLLTETKIDREKFKELLQQASALISEIATRAVNNPESHAPQQETLEEREEPNRCRAPFTLTVRTGKTSQTASGCRSNAEGASFGHFAKEVEFFLYSKK